MDNGPRYIGRNPAISDIKLLTVDIIFRSSPQTKVSESRLSVIFLSRASEIV